MPLSGLRIAYSVEFADKGTPAAASVTIIAPNFNAKCDISGKLSIEHIAKFFICGIIKVGILNDFKHTLAKW